MIELIDKFFNRNTKKETPENYYDPTPRIQKTVQPEVRASYNEVFEHINEQLKKK